MGCSLVGTTCAGHGIMTRHSPDQAPVRTVHFDRATRTLRVHLENGAVYDFADVPEHLYDELVRSANPDTFFRENIKGEFIGTRAGDVDLAELAHERREDAILGPPLAEEIEGATDDRAVETTPADEASVRASRHTWVVDVIDEDAAVVEVDGRRITPIPRWLLPSDARDGDVLRVTHARSSTRSTFTVEVDRHATRRAVQRSADQLRDAPAGGTGDIGPTA